MTYQHPLPSSRNALLNPLTIILAMIQIPAFLPLLAVLSLANAQLVFPILSDKSYNLIPGDTLIRQQLSSWGITIRPLTLRLSLDPGSIDRRSQVAARETVRAKRRASDSGSTRSRARSTDLSLSLGADLGAGSATTSGSGISLGLAGQSGVNLGLTEQSGIAGWGGAENVAKGESGDTEVRFSSSNEA